MTLPPPAPVPPASTAPVLPTFTTRPSLGRLRGNRQRVTVYPNRIELQPRRRGPLSAGVAETIPLRMVSTVATRRLFLRRFTVSVTAAGNMTTFRARPGDARRFRDTVSGLIVHNA